MERAGQLRFDEAFDAGFNSGVSENISISSQEFIVTSSNRFEKPVIPEATHTVKAKQRVVVPTHAGCAIVTCISPTDVCIIPKRRFGGEQEYVILENMVVYNGIFNRYWTVNEGIHIGVCGTPSSLSNRGRR